MSVARTIRIKHLVIAHSYEQFKRIMADKGWPKEDYVHVTSEDQLKGFHFFPVQNCALHILGNHPIMTTDTFRNLILEKAIDEK